MEKYDGDDKADKARDDENNGDCVDEAQIADCDG